MNVFFVTKDGKLVTPELTGTILPGITRMSILELAKEFGLTPEERKVEIQEWKDGVASGDILESLRVRHRGHRHPDRWAEVGRR